MENSLFYNLAYGEAKKLLNLIDKAPIEVREELLNDITGFVQRMKDKYDNEIKEDE